jgi:phage terminase large subunit
LSDPIDFAEAFEPLFLPARYKIYYGGRGSGKSWAFARALLVIASKKKVRVLCTRELQSSIQESVHRLLSDQIAAMGLQSRFEIQQTTIKGKNGSEFIFEGVRSNVDKIKSMEGIDICWVEEADKVREASWAVLIPTIRAEGSEIWVSFNPYLRTDATWQRFVEFQPPNSVVRKVSWRDNPWFPSELQAELEHLKAVNYEEYLHVWEGEFKSFADGAVFGKQLKDAREQGRIRAHLPLPKSVEIHTTWDLGKSDSTAVWFFARVGPEVRFVDYLEGRGEDIDYYAKAVKAKGYNTGKHYMPHDVDHEILGLGSRNRRQMFEDAGIKPIVVVPRIAHLNEGIEIVRSQFPTYWFDAEKCERGIECLQNYRYEENARTLDWKPEPLHDWSSHAADALRQQAQANGGISRWGVVMNKDPTRREKKNPWHQQSANWMV